MLHNYFKIALRNLLRSKAFSMINIAGLSLGIAACLMMMIFVQDELTYDHFHKHGKSIYRIGFSDYLGMGPYATTPLPVGPAAKEEIAGITGMTRVQFASNLLVRHNDEAFFENILLVDEDFFSVFDFKMYAGNPREAFALPNQIVISEDMARKYFGSEDPIGKLLQIGSTGKMNSMVSGVVKKVPGNSQLQFDFLMSLKTYDRLGYNTSLWTQMPHNYTYVRIADGVDPGDLAKSLNQLGKKYAAKDAEGKSYDIIVQPLFDIHLRSHMGGELSTNGNALVIYSSAAIAIIILLIAWVNYVNLTSARYSRRIKEVGIRKSSGATRKQLVLQFLGESIIMSICAGIMAILLTDLLLPLFNELANKSISSRYFTQPVFMAGVVLFTLLTGVGAGLFPSLYMAKCNVIRAMKSMPENSKSRVGLRSVLVVGQFVATMILIAATLVVFSQMTFIRESLGHDEEEQVLVFSINSKLDEQFIQLQNRLLQHPQIIDVSASSSVPSFYGDSWPVASEMDGPRVQTENYVVDDHYLKVMGYDLLAGRMLNHLSANDSSAFIINETAIRELGLKSPDEAIGHVLYWGGGTNRIKGEVVGVTRDFHFDSFKEKISPALLHFAPYDWMTYNFVVIRLRTEQLQETIAAIRKDVAAIDEGWLVDYKFFDENFQHLHQKDVVEGRLFSAFSCIAVLISCLGLLGLSMYAVGQRSKEIGVRKVLGATSAGLMILLIKDFVRLFLVSFLLAMPVAILVTQQWLQEFAYRIPFTPSIFIYTGGLTLLVVILTVSYQTIKAAGINPVAILRSE